MPDVKIDGQLPLADITERIRDLEVTRHRFVGAVISGTQNIASFVADRVPAKPHLVFDGGLPPVAAIPQWSGDLCVEGKTRRVQLYRELNATDAAADLRASGETAARRAAPTTPVLGRADVIARATSAADTETPYVSPGKSPPLQAARWPDSWTGIDCSGFVAWCFRMSRRVTHPLYVKTNGGWFETTALHRDGMDVSGLFRPLERARPGSLLVYPDRDGKDGHVGLVMEADGPGIAGVRAIVHCSAGNHRRTGRAIRTTDATPWVARNDSLIIDYDGFLD
jgi:cell wall-associated NlpC family hydrolase